MGPHTAKYAKKATLSTLALAIAAAFFLSVIPSEVLPEADDHSCGEHPEDACQDCPNCIQCSNMLKLMAFNDSELFEYYPAHQKATLNNLQINLDNLAVSIDHPPQNLS